MSLCDPMDCSPPGASVRGIRQARILEWVAIPFSRLMVSICVFDFMFCSYVVFLILLTSLFVFLCSSLNFLKTTILSYLLGKSPGK